MIVLMCVVYSCHCVMLRSEANGYIIIMPSTDTRAVFVGSFE